MRSLPAFFRTRTWTMATALAAACGLVVACSSNASNSLDNDGYGTWNDGGGSESGSSSGASSGSGGGDAATSGCTAGDLVTQMQCGAGKACDVVRRSMTFGSGSGGGAGDGGGGGGGDGGGGGGGAGTGDGGGTGVGDEMLTCRNATSSGTEGVACTPSDPTTCAAGYTCGEPADGSTDAVCYKFCSSDADCTAPGGWCRAGALQTGAMEGFTAKTCSLNCDPIAQKGCGTGQNCDLAITPDRTRLYTQCIAAGTGGYQAACTRAEDCMPGYSCLKVSVNGGPVQQLCLQACVAGGADGGAGSCAQGQTCRAIAPPNTLGSTQYGWCY